MNKLIFIVILFIFCAGLCGLNCTPDNDLWARLIAGQYFFENFSVPKTDFLSYTPTHIWYDHEWGASVIFYGVFKYFGKDGLVLLKGILLFITIFICFKTIELRGNKSPNCYNILYYILMAVSMFSCLGATVRCLLFTCIFFSLFLYILERARLGKPKGLFFIPIIMLFWCNIHGGCISGLGIIGIYILGEFLNKQDIKKYIYTLLACLAVLFINPYGIEYVKFLFYAAAMKRSFITEWQSPFIKKYFDLYLFYKGYLIVMVITAVIYQLKNKISYLKIDKTKYLILIITMFLSLNSIRHIAFFVICSGIFLHDEFYSLFDIFKNKNLKLLKNITLYVLIFVIFTPVLLCEKRIRITEKGYPRFAVEFIKINNITGNLYVNFDWGSYAAYKLYPHNLIVMDGRYEEVYNPELLVEMKNFHNLKNDWEKIIREYPPDVMIIEKKYPVFNIMQIHPKWELVFENNLSGVFVPKDKVKQNYIYPESDDDYYNKNIFANDIDFKKRT